MSDIPATKRQLKIKTGAAQRLEKELSYYEREIKDLKRSLNKLADSAEEWDFKNTKRMIEESDKMITDTRKRLEEAAGGLKDLVLQVKSEPELAGTEELSKAEEVLEKAKDWPRGGEERIGAGGDGGAEEVLKKAGDGPSFET